MNEDEMMEEQEMESPEEEMTEQPEPAAEGAPDQGMPQEMQDQIVKGAVALFHTALQVIAANSMKDILKRNLSAGRLSPATWIVLTEAVKVHAKQGLPITPPMMMGAVPFVAQFLQSLAQKMGARVDDRHVKKATLETIDKLIGKYEGSKMLDRHREQARTAQQPQQGMGAQAAPAPQAGGLM